MLVACSALLRGATLVCYAGSPDFPDWSRMSRIVERHQVTHFGSAPTLIRGMASNEAIALAGDRSTVRLLITAGEVCDAEHFCWFQQKFGGGRHPLINYTGGTEVSGGLLGSVEGDGGQGDTALRKGRWGQLGGAQQQSACQGSDHDLLQKKPATRAAHAAAHQGTWRARKRGVSGQAAPGREVASRGGSASRLAVVHGPGGAGPRAAEAEAAPP